MSQNITKGEGTFGSAGGRFPERGSVRPPLPLISAPDIEVLSVLAQRTKIKTLKFILRKTFQFIVTPISVKLSESEFVLF